MNPWRLIIDPGLIYPSVGNKAPWPDARLVKPDLIISRAIGCRWQQTETGILSFEASTNMSLTENLLRRAG